MKMPANYWRILWGEDGRQKLVSQIHGKSEYPFLKKENVLASVVKPN